MKAVLFSATLLIALTGCRIGNYVETVPNPDTLSGYYETQPESLLFCATSAGTTRCKNATTARIPSLLSQVMSNPVRLVMFDLESGSAAFTPPGNDRIGLPTVAKSDRTLDFFGSDSPRMLLNDAKCTTQLYLEEKGKLTTEGPFTTGSTFRMSGRMDAQFQVVQFFDAAKPGDCDASLATIRDCLNNVNLCGGTTAAANTSLQSQFQSLFNEYFASGALTIAEVATLSNIAYVVQYR